MRIEAGDIIRLFGESESHEVIRREGKNDLILSDHRMVSEYRVQYQKPLSAQIDEYIGLSPTKIEEWNYRIVR